MKILIINRGYSQGGGAEAAVRGLAQFASLSGNQVMVLILKYGTGGWEIECREEGGIQICSFQTLSNRLAERKNKQLISRFFVFLFDWLNGVGPIKALRMIRKLKPDVVHTHNVRGMGMLLPLFIRMGKGSARWVHTVHDIQLVYPRGVLMYPALERIKNKDGKNIPPAISNDRGIWRWIGMRGFEVMRRGYAVVQRMVWGSPEVVVSPSEFLKKFYQERGFFSKSKFEVIPNIVEADGRDSSSRLRMTNGNQRGREVKRSSVLFVGALEENKGIRVLFDALKDKNLNVSVDVVGEGSLGMTLRQAYAFAEAPADRQDDRLIFHGKLSAEKIQELFHGVIITVVPSVTYENAPMVILESLRAGVPVIASRIGGIPEYIYEGVTGWLVEPGSVGELRRRLELIVSEGVDEDVRRNCVRKAIDLGVQAQAGYMRVLRG